MQIIHEMEFMLCLTTLLLDSLLIAGVPPMDVPPVEPPMPVPPMDGTADHPDHYIPEPVRHFLPYFHKQILEKVHVI